MIALLGGVVYGTVGYIFVEHYSLLDALFMTMITISSVGYEEVHPLGPVGKIFTMTLITVGVLDFLYTFGVLVELLSGSDWRVYRRYRRMNKLRDQLQDHVIVCGYGRMGKQVVNELRSASHPYLVIERDPEPLADVQRDQEPHVVGDAASDEILHLAGIDRAAALVTVVDSDERNVYIVLTARSLNPGLLIVARSSYPHSQAKLHRAGADRVVSPYTLSGNHMAALAMQHAVVDVLDMVVAGDNHRMAIEEMRVPGALGTASTAGDLRKSGAVVLALRGAGGGLNVNPADDEELAKHQLVVAMGTPAQLRVVASALSPRDAS